MNIIVIGAGAWGTALAVSAARRQPVTLWARDPVQAAAMAAGRCNDRYLPQVPFPKALTVSCTPVPDLPALAAQHALVMVATPMSALRETLAQLKDLTVPVVWLCKGFEAPQSAQAWGLLGHELAAQVAPRLAVGMLGGPSFALEVARAQPTALVAASPNPRVREALVRAFHGPSLRTYANDDIVGVEVGGAVKNLLAIATGFCDGLKLGMNARAALITRGLAEITRLGVALGARTDTFMGLSGMGDLVLTATGDLSRNRTVGLLLAQGLTQAEAVASLGHVAEGVYSARTVVQRARHLGVEMPISESVVALLEGQLKPRDAVTMLMEREPRPEDPIQATSKPTRGG